MLPGIKIQNLNKNFDERGYFAELIRMDSHDFLEQDIPAQISLSISYPGMIRAWHHHARGQIDYFIVINGVVKICAYDDNPNSPTKGQIDEFVVSGEKLQIVRIPGLYWHGTKTVGLSPSTTIYAVSKLYDRENPDENRRPWNDKTIIDPRTKQSYDWDKPPHK